MGLSFNIEPLSNELDKIIQSKIDLKTKPIGSLGKLEQIAFQIAKIQNTTVPRLNQPTIVVFAADHGIAKTGLVNPYPQEVTFQMVMNFVQGGAAINIFAKQNNIELKVVDAGVNFDFGETPEIINQKIDFGTKNYLEEQAMTSAQLEDCFIKGSDIVEKTFNSGCNIIGFGEMGISNTSSSALLMSSICDLPIESCVGNGTGVDSEQLQTKIETLGKAQVKHQNIDTNDPMELLQTFGGFEIAQMCGAMLKAAELGMTIIVDGFISTAALLVAQKINSHVLDYCVYSHHSNEKGHGMMLAYLFAKPIIGIDMRLGEGSGIAVAYPLIESACKFLNEMASFESANITNKA